MDALVAFAAVVAALLFATFAEYFIHRGMHWGFIYPKGHLRHHEENEARTYLLDFLDYGSGALVVCWLGFLISVPAGIGWALGAVLYTALASYAHQLQHANAELVFWMRRPVHRLHHVHDMRDANFGILVDWWDRLFGTYAPIEYPHPDGPRRLRDYMAIPWR
jgi:sterol desaturase/sphingolipid hydroxylase (fatty acid hydroxylase superfamily)